jgi:capsular polysaccharide transport system permease protein
MNVARMKDFFGQHSGFCKWLRSRHSAERPVTSDLDADRVENQPPPYDKFVKWLRNPFFWLVVVPVVLGIIFFGLIATDMFVSEASMTVRTSKGLSSDVSSGSMLSLTPTNTDSYVVYEYIRSPDILRQLDAEIGIRAHYSNRKADIFTRLSETATDEELLKYYQSVVGVSLDSLTGIIKLKVRAYDPTFAHRLAQKIIKYSEDLVNKMSERSVRDTLLLAQSELERAQALNTKARIKIKEFRLRNSDFNPVMSSVGG